MNPDVFRDISLETEHLLLQTLGKDMAGPVTRYLVDNRQFFKKAGPRIRSEFYSEAFQTRRLQNEVYQRSNGEAFRVFLLWKGGSSGKMVIGDISVSNIIMGPFRSATLGYKLDQNFTGQGMMREALQELISFLFETVGLERLEANIRPDNHPSILLISRLGFNLDGRSPKYLEIDGRKEDHLRFSMLKEDWRPEGDLYFKKGLKPVFLNLFSEIRVKFYQYEGTLVLVAAASGRFRMSPHSQMDANHLFRRTEEAFLNVKACGLLWDFRELDFHEAPEMDQLLRLPSLVVRSDKQGDKIPVGVIVSEKCRVGISKMLGSDGKSLPWNCFQHLEEGLEWIEEAARAYLLR